MTHHIILAEGYVDSLDQFEKDFNGKMYANNTARLRVRELRLYTIAINESGNKEFLSDLLSLQGRIWGDRDDGSFKWNGAIGWIKKILWPFGLKDVDFKDIPNSGWRGALADGKHNYNAHFVSLGYVPDPKDKDGREIV